jgi:hypothetical protein
MPACLTLPTEIMVNTHGRKPMNRPVLRRTSRGELIEIVIKEIVRHYLVITLRKRAAFPPEGVVRYQEADSVTGMKLDESQAVEFEQIGGSLFLGYIVLCCDA